MGLNLKTLKPGWRMTMFVVFFLPLTVSLGFWQLSRAAEKEAMEFAYLESLTKLPVAPGEQLQDFQRVRLTGRLTIERFMIENQVRDGQVGYWVVQLFYDEKTDRNYLVNRGFFPITGEGDDKRVKIPRPREEISLVGVVWPNTGLVPLLRDEPVGDPWPKTRQRMDIEAFAREANAEPYEIRLEESEWAPLPAPFSQVMSPDTHYGYAATWFGLAVALVILYIGWGRKNAIKEQVDEA